MKGIKVKKRLFIVIFLFLLSGSGLFVLSAAIAHPVDAAPLPVNSPAQTTPNETCLACHSRPGQIVTLESGEPLVITVESEQFQVSAHGQAAVTCTQCHSDITGFPHPPRVNKSLREFTLNYSAACKQCHEEQTTKHSNSVHQKALDSGNPNAATCADCHNPHYGKPLAEMPRTAVPQTCAHCHNAIYETYSQSIHGSALIGEGNPDVPTCVDCHGSHDIQNPTTAAFRNNTPLLCARCHTDKSIMDKYQLSTDVLSTYVADFHGSTVTLFEQTHPDLPTNKPVCTDCHGVHNIRRVDDPQYGIAMKQNLLVACQRCHPDATADFPDAWMKHYTPSPEKYPIVYFVNLFYKIFIPLVLGGMAVFVVTDFVRRLIDRRKGAAH